MACIWFGSTLCAEPMGHRLRADLFLSENPVREVDDGVVVLISWTSHREETFGFA
jgi:hypothetical protein